jgi:hypothetical protein
MKSKNEDQQLELSIQNSNVTGVRCLGAGTERRNRGVTGGGWRVTRGERAGWWFAQMRQLVDRAAEKEKEIDRGAFLAPMT